MDSLFNIVEIEINSDCNRSCSYCPNSISQRKEQGRMEPDVFERIITQLHDIRFCGRISYHFYGEPLLSPYLSQYVSYTKKILPDTRRVLFSNGDLLDKNKVSELTDAGITKFVITNHEGSSHPFAHILQKLPVDTANNITYVPHQSLLLTNRSGKLNNGYKGEFLDCPCIIPSLLIIITVKGHVLPCYDDYDQTLVMGNIKHEHVRDIWYKPNYQSHRNELKNGNRAAHVQCSKCDNRAEYDADEIDFVGYEL